MHKFDKKIKNIDYDKMIKGNIKLAITIKILYNYMQ